MAGSDEESRSEAAKRAAFAARHAQPRRSERDPDPNDPEATAEPPAAPPTPLVRRTVARSRGIAGRVYRGVLRRVPTPVKTHPLTAPLGDMVRAYRRRRGGDDPALAARGSRYASAPLSGAAARRRRAEAAARHAVARPAEVTPPPSVSALIVNRNRAAQLERLLSSLATHEAEADLEVVVVDHGSKDGSREVLDRWSSRLDVKVILLEVEASVAASTNRAARAARGERLLLLGPDVVFETPLLAELNGYLDDRRTGIVAPSLRWPEAHPEFPKGLRHGGIKFYPDAGEASLRPYRIGAAEGLTAADEAGEHMPAVAAACALVRHADFEALEGLSEELAPGDAGVDLCLRLARGLGLRSVVAHELVAAFDEGEPAATAARSPDVGAEAHRAHFDGRHGWALRRAWRRDLVEGARWLTDAPLTVGLALTEGRATEGELGRAFEAELGWAAVSLADREDEYDLAGIDLLLSRPEYDLRRVHDARPGLITAAWVRAADPEGVAGGLDEYDLVFCDSDEGVQSMLRTRSRRAERLPVPSSGDDQELSSACSSVQTVLQSLSDERLRIAIKVPATNHEVKETWGDYHFALALRRCFWRRGHAVRIDVLCDWDTPQSIDDDVVLVLRGLCPYTPNPRHVNLMWNISHPDKIPDDEYEAYDHVFVASVPHARALDARLEVPVSPLLQCTDPDLFFPDEDDAVPAAEVLFLGNSRRHLRPGVEDAIEAGLPLTIYGGGWSGLIDPRFVAGAHVPNDQVRKHYSNAAVVLNDHWPSMRDIGFLSNRLFDAAACGATIVSDPALGIEEVFGAAIETYGTIEELTSAVRRVLDDRVGARARARALSETVRREHSFERRAEAILEVALERVRAFDRDAPLPVGNRRGSSDLR